MTCALSASSECALRGVLVCRAQKMLGLGVRRETHRSPFEDVRVGCPLGQSVGTVFFADVPVHDGVGEVASDAEYIVIGGLIFP